MIWWWPRSQKSPSGSAFVSWTLRMTTFPFGLCSQVAAFLKQVIEILAYPDLHNDGRHSLGILPDCCIRSCRPYMLSLSTTVLYQYVLATRANPAHQVTTYFRRGYTCSESLTLCCLDGRPGLSLSCIQPVENSCKSPPSALMMT